MRGHNTWTHVRARCYNHLSLCPSSAPSASQCYHNVIIYAIKVSSPQQSLLMSQTGHNKIVNHNPGHICTFIKIRVKWKLKL